MTVGQVNQALEGYEAQWDLVQQLLAFHLGYSLMPNMKHGKSGIVKKLYNALTRKKKNYEDLSTEEKESQKSDFWKNVRQRRYRQQKAREHGTRS